jgi:hypothetical protein
VEDKLTPAVRELVTLTGLLEPFAEGAQKLLPRMSGLSISAATVRRVTEQAGEDLARRRAEGEFHGPDGTWNWNRDDWGQTVAYLELDATSVPQQGERAKKADGRMPWVAGVFNPRPKARREERKSPHQARYVSGLMSLEEIGRQLREECQAVGLPEADVVVALTDGGAGLEDCLIESVRGLVTKELVFVLDFYHVSEHLVEFSKGWLTDEARRREWVERSCERLKAQGGASLLLDLEGLEPAEMTPSARAAHRQLVGYVRHNVHRMNYPRYVARGWRIGSGAIESACKSVVSHRLKGPGMRWRERGTTGLCQLRALYQSETPLWTAFWSRTLAE